MTTTYDTKIAILQGGDKMKIGTDANGLGAILTSGTGTTDGTIVSDIGADPLYADGSIYISVVDGAGKVFQKQNDVWVDLQA